MHKIEFESHSIVLLGTFNPAIFQPAWFAAEKIIKAKEGKEAKIEIIHPDIVLFTLDWIRIQVVRNKFVASCLQQGHEEEMRDFVLSTFKLLRHTPIVAMGINEEINFFVKNEEEWHKIGHKFTPKEIWATVLLTPGMRILTIEGQREDGYNGYIQVKVEPMRKKNNGVSISTNDHYAIREGNEVVNAEEILSILENNWKKSLSKSSEIINHLLENL